MSARRTDELRQRARQEGFEAIAVSHVGPLERDGRMLERWLQAGHEAGMGWMSRDPALRSDPARLLPGCRSVVSVAMNYWPGESAGTAGRWGRVARYAQARDYHRVMGDRLKRLCEWLSEEGADARHFVDTGPVLERAWAERSGIGWIGKNANLLTREMGSWVLLGELLTTAELVADRGPHEDFCGTCTACLDGCPTGAIREPGVVDSTRCISYWTIEHRGTVPVEKRELLDDWIFGCDVCQSVCPWNHRFARPADDTVVQRRKDLDGLDPEEILALDEAAFRERYSGTALMRAKWEGMRRNACILLGNRGRSEALPALVRALSDPDPVVRAHAAWAIGRIGGERARELLQRAASDESYPAVREEIDHALKAPGNA